MKMQVRIFTFVFVFFLLVLSTYAQVVNAEYITDLSTEVSESSALCIINHKLFTLNDSGGNAEVYELDTVSGNVIRTVVVDNAVNVDWEAMAVNQTHLFIGDFGNNQGSRTNLSIYKIPLDDFLSSDTVMASQINFAYQEQEDFSNQMFQTNFDAEAMIAISDSVYVFTKNWGDGNTNLYAIPVEEGSYAVSAGLQFNAQSLVTDAYFNASDQTLSLLSYNFSQVFLSIFSVENELINFDNLEESFELDVSSSIQAEGLSMTGENYWVSAEQFSSFDACLYKISDFQTQDMRVLTNDYGFKVYPNPSFGAVNFNNCAAGLIRIYNSKGDCYLTLNPQECSEVFLPKGFYIVYYQNLKEGINSSEKLIVL